MELTFKKFLFFHFSFIAYNFSIFCFHLNFIPKKKFFLIIKQKTLKISCYIFPFFHNYYTFVNKNFFELIIVQFFINPISKIIDSSVYSNSTTSWIPITIANNPVSNSFYFKAFKTVHYKIIYPPTYHLPFAFRQYMPPPESPYKI